MPRWSEKIAFVFADMEIYNRFSLIVRAYFANAITCFMASNFIASVAMSSASVEIAINEDERLLEYRGSLKEWRNLNVRLLSVAKEKGLPIEKLLIQGDDLGKGNVWFILRRNKFAHGEIYLSTQGQVPLLMDRKGKNIRVLLSSRPETMALQQLMSAHSFLKALYSESHIS